MRLLLKSARQTGVLTSLVASLATVSTVLGAALPANVQDDHVSVADHRDPPNPDPYKYELQCFPKNDPEDWLATTQLCRSEYRFGCDAEGHMTHRKDNEECLESCRCYEWTEDEGKPKPVDRSPGQKASTQQDSPEMASRIEAASPIDFVDFVRNEPVSNVKRAPDISDEADTKFAHGGGDDLNARGVLHDYAVGCYKDQGEEPEDIALQRACIAPPYRYTCNANRWMGRVKSHESCERGCRCVLMNPRPKIIGWGPDQAPKGGIWNRNHKDRRETVSVQIPGGGILNSRKIALHDWGPVCSRYNQQDSDLTKECMNLPYSYSCNALGQIVYRMVDAVCTRACTCQNFNPRPKLIGWPPGKVPQSGSWGRSLVEQAGADTSRDPKSLHRDVEVPESSFELTTRGILHDWALVCDDRAGNSRDWMEICIGPPYNYRCDKQGKMSFAQKYDECSSKCSCHNMNPLPKILNWNPNQVPKGGSWGKRQLETEGQVPAENVESTEVAIPEVPGISKALWHHNDGQGGLLFYELTCFTDEQPDKTLTTSCDFDPWIYYCDLEGNITYLQIRDDCHKRCKCLPENPRPTVLNWPVGAVPRPGWWKRATIDAPAEDDKDTDSAGGEAVRAYGADKDLGAPPTDVVTEQAGRSTTGLNKRHDWALICKPNDKPDKKWIELCRTAWGYDCGPDGKRTYKKQYDQCDRLCDCDNVNPMPLFPLGKPVSFPNGHSNRLQREAGPAHVTALIASGNVEGTLATRGANGWALSCKRRENRVMVEDVELTTKCLNPPHNYDCNTVKGSVTRAGLESLTCNEQCECETTNPKPEISNWSPDQIPASGSWSRLFKRIRSLLGVSDAFSDSESGRKTSPGDTVEESVSQSLEGLNHARGASEDRVESARQKRNEIVSDVESESSHAVMAKRHEYGIVCELDGKRNNPVTKACRDPPRSYSCDRYGALTKARYDSYCDQHCACQNMKPAPVFKGGSSVGSMAKPCLFCKRDSDDSFAVRNEEEHSVQENSGDSTTLEPHMGESFGIGNDHDPGSSTDDQDGNEDGTRKAMVEDFIVECDYKDPDKAKQVARRCKALPHVLCNYNKHRLIFASGSVVRGDGERCKCRKPDENVSEQQELAEDRAIDYQGTPGKENVARDQGPEDDATDFIVECAVSDPRKAAELASGCKNLPQVTCNFVKGRLIFNNGSSVRGDCEQCKCYEGSPAHKKPDSLPPVEVTERL